MNNKTRPDSHCVYIIWHFNLTFPTRCFKVTKQKIMWKICILLPKEKQITVKWAKINERSLKSFRCDEICLKLNFANYYYYYCYYYTNEIWS